MRFSGARVAKQDEVGMISEIGKGPRMGRGFPVRVGGNVENVAVGHSASCTISAFRLARGFAVWIEMLGSSMSPFGHDGRFGYLANVTGTLPSGMITA